MERLFRHAGYEWELRRAGDIGIGIWKMPLHKTATANPRRLVFMPGFGDTALSWLSTLALARSTLRHHYDEIVLFDFPGFHGFLRHERCVPEMDQLLRITLDALDSLKPRTIMGHSLGGWLAAHYAVECGEGERPFSGGKTYTGPESLVLVSPSGVFHDEADRTAWAAKFEEAMKTGTPKFMKRLFFREPMLFRAFASEFDGFMEREDTVEFMKSFRRDHEVQTRLSSVRAKTWVIWGEEDALSPSSWTKLWVDLLPPGLGKGVLMPGTGHMPQMERPAIMAMVLRQVLGSSALSPAAPRWWRLVS